MERFRASSAPSRRVLTGKGGAERAAQVASQGGGPDQSGIGSGNFWPTAGRTNRHYTGTGVGVVVVHHLDALRPNGAHPVSVKVAARLDDGQQIRLFCVAHGHQLVLEFRSKRLRRVKRRRPSSLQRQPRFLDAGRLQRGGQMTAGSIAADWAGAQRRLIGADSPGIGGQRLETLLTVQRALA